jgi:CCR4-NOT complex subunit CAF16
VDLDVLRRLDLLRFFKQECEERKCIIIYATHIFDGLGEWMTHVVLVSDGKVAVEGPASSFPEIKEGKLLHTAIKWLRAERERVRAQPKEQAVVKKKSELFGSRQMSFFK